MCLILMAYQVHPDYPLVLAANRDELYQRATAPASFWEDAPAVLAGRDLLHGGTWLGVTRDGRFAAVTNLRDATPLRGDAPSRGELAADFLLAKVAPQRYLEQVLCKAGRYNGFNLVVGDGSGIYCLSSGSAGTLTVAPGIHGISNHPLDRLWPKTVRGKALLEETLLHSCSEEGLLAVLSDSTPPAAPSVAQGEAEEGETVLSPIFIRSDSFGTRSSTVLLFDGRGRAVFVERTFSRQMPPVTARFEFTLSEGA